MVPVSLFLPILDGLHNLTLNTFLRPIDLPVSNFPTKEEDFVCSAGLVAYGPSPDGSILARPSNT